MEISERFLPGHCINCGRTPIPEGKLFCDDAKCQPEPVADVVTFRRVKDLSPGEAGYIFQDSALFLDKNQLYVDGNSLVASKETPFGGYTTKIRRSKRSLIVERKSLNYRRLRRSWPDPIPITIFTCSIE